MKRFVRLMAGAALAWGFYAAWRARRRERATVLYDGACPLCRRTVARLRRWDTRRALDYLDARDSAAMAARFPRLAPDPDLREMRLVFPDGEVLGGFDAVRALCAMLPPLRGFSPLLFLPGTLPLGRAAYRFVAARRQNLHRTENCHV